MKDLIHYIKSLFLKPALTQVTTLEVTKVEVETKTAPVIQEEKPEDKPEKMNILLVDDDPGNRLIIKTFCINTPWQIDEADNGKTCCEMVKNKNYDLIILDVHMPIMGGIEATQIIRNWEKENELKPHFIIALTASVFTEQIERCLNAGYDTHLAKPIKKDNFLAFMQNISNQSNKRAA